MTTFWEIAGVVVLTLFTAGVGAAFAVVVQHVTDKLKRRRAHLDDFADSIRTEMTTIRTKWDDSISDRTFAGYIDAVGGLRHHADYIERKHPDDWKSIEFDWKCFSGGEGSGPDCYHLPPDSGGSGTMVAIDKRAVLRRLSDLLYAVERQ